MIVTPAISRGSSALTALPKKIRRISSAAGSTIISARARSSSMPGPMSCERAAPPPTSVGEKPGGVPSAARISSIRSSASRSPSGSVSVAKVMWPSWPTRSRLPVPKYDTTRVPGTTAAARSRERVTASR